jgi:hypothetical protein
MLVEVQRSGSPVVVDDLDDDFVLHLIRDSEVQAREAERRRLRLARHWAERHAVSDALEAAHWTDVDPRDGSYTWTSPHGQRYTVDVRGVVTEQ